MEFNQFRNSIELIAHNFRFKIAEDKQESKTWIKMLYKACDSFLDEDLQYAFRRLMTLTRDDWNKTYPYGAAPPIGDWIKLFQERKTLEKSASKAKRNLEAIKKARLEAFERTAKEIFPNDAEKAKKLLNNLIIRNGELPPLSIST